MNQLKYSKGRLTMSTKKVDVEPVSNQLKKPNKWLGPTLKVKLYRYQRKAVRKATELGSIGLWMEQGTGKTLTSLKIVGNYWKKGLINNLLILGPKSVLTVWEQEISENLLIPYQYTDSVLKPVSNPKCLTICLANYESFRRYKGKANKVKKSYDMVIADESHRIKNPNSIQSKQAYFLSRHSKYRLALSGTPKGNDDFDLFAQYRFINDQIFGPKTTVFRDKYFDRCGFMGHDLKLKGNKKYEFYKIVNDNCFRITKDEALDLPLVTETIVPVELSPKIKKIYEKLESEKYLDLGDTQIEGDLAVKLVTKLQQICCGFIYDEDKKPVELDIYDKVSYLKEILSDHKGERFVIFCKFTHEVDLLEKFLAKDYKVQVYDGRSEASSWKKFLSGKSDILITQIQKGGTGLNLQIASTVIFFSLSYSYIDLSQAKDRVHRNGQKHKVSIYYLLAKNSIERSIFRVLKAKRSGAKEILDDYRLASPKN